MHHSKYKSAQLRKGRVSLPNQIYSITAVTHQRIFVFKELKHCRTLIKNLMECEHRKQAKTLCFVVMPDHFHWLMQLNGQEELSHIIRKVKVLTARHI